MSVELEKLKAELSKLLELEDVKARIARLKELNVNPFAKNPDGTPEGYADLKEAIEIFHELLLAAITRVEYLSKDLKDVLTMEDKLDAVIAFADDIIKLPWYLDNKPINLDGRLLRATISMLVAQLNKFLGKDWLNQIPDPTVVNSTTPPPTNG
jgi:hypothetical protein